MASNLLDFDNDELGRLQRCESDNDIDHAAVDIVLSGRFAVALDEIGLLRIATLKRALNKQIVHKGADVKPDLRPQSLVIGLEHDPLCAPVKTLLDIERRAAHWDILPGRSQAIVTREGPRTPDYRTDTGSRPQAVNAERIKFAYLGICERDAQL